MSRTTPASTKAQKSQCFFLLVKASPAKGRRRLQKNTDFFVLLCLPASFLTFGKVNPGPPQSAFVLAPASGRSTTTPLRLTFFWGGVPPHPPPSFLSAPGPLRLTFFGEGGGGGDQITTLHIPDWVSEVSGELCGVTPMLMKARDCFAATHCTAEFVCSFCAIIRDEDTTDTRQEPTKMCDSFQARIDTDKTNQYDERKQGKSQERPIVTWRAQLGRFQLYARTPSYFVPYFCPNFNFSAVLSIFSMRCQNRTPCYILGRFLSSQTPN